MLKNSRMKCWADAGKNRIVANQKNLETPSSTSILELMYPIKNLFPISSIIKNSMCSRSKIVGAPKPKLRNRFG